jgi:hypothetical protein
VVALKAGGASLFTCAAIVSAGQPVGVAVTLVAALVLSGSVLRDLLVPVRVAVDREGLVVVTGFAGRRSLPWQDVKRIHVDDRRRLGARSRLLEIETEESLYLFGGAELAASVESVADDLRSRWASWRSAQLAADQPESPPSWTGA